MAVDGVVAVGRVRCRRGSGDGGDGVGGCCPSALMVVVELKGQRCWPRRRFAGPRDFVGGEGAGGAPDDDGAAPRGRRGRREGGAGGLLEESSRV
jgi:hypothetical protein